MNIRKINGTDNWIFNIKETNCNVLGEIRRRLTDLRYDLYRCGKNTSTTYYVQDHRVDFMVNIPEKNLFNEVFKIFVEVLINREQYV